MSNVDMGGCRPRVRSTLVKQLDTDSHASELGNATVLGGQSQVMVQREGQEGYTTTPVPAPVYHQHQPTDRPEAADGPDPSVVKQAAAPGIDLRPPEQRQGQTGPAFNNGGPDIPDVNGLGAAHLPPPTPPQPQVATTPHPPAVGSGGPTFVKKQQVVIESPTMGRHRVVVADVAVSDTLVCLFYLNDGSMTIVEPPPCTPDNPITVTTNPSGPDKQRMEVMYGDWTADVGEMLMVVFVRV